MTFHGYTVIYEAWIFFCKGCAAPFDGRKKVGDAPFFSTGASFTPHGMGLGGMNVEGNCFSWAQ